MSPPDATAPPTVYVVDDDESIRELLGWLMRRIIGCARVMGKARPGRAESRPVPVTDPDLAAAVDDAAAVGQFAPQFWIFRQHFRNPVG